MKAVQWMAALAAVSLSLPGPAWAGANDPEVIIYRFTGVRDDGGGMGIGLITVFDCTNFSGTSESLRFVTRDGNTVLKSNVPVPGVTHLQTVAVVTHDPANFFSQVNLNTGLVKQGTTAIAATSTSIICGARLFDATGSNPSGGYPLRGIRFNPIPGSQE